jgi:ornithine cyclodeaminase/alanine dehydrogenase-like protein (mu-crystallin family)
MRGEIEPERLAASSPMYKSVGGGLQDVVIAEMVLGRALEAGLATPLPISFLKKGS